MKKLLDKDIREPLFLYLEIRYGKARFFEEKTIGRSRADVVMVTDVAITGLEIKRILIRVLRVRYAITINTSTITMWSSVKVT